MAKTCAACGTQNDDGAEFCAKCARRLDAATEARVTQVRADAAATQVTGLRWSAILISTVVFMAVILVVVVLLVLVVH